MHEWALAEAIVKSIEYTALNNRRYVIRNVVIRLGELQNIDVDVLNFALQELIKELGESRHIQVLRFSLEIEEATFVCRRCGNKWRLKDLSLSEEEREAIHFIPEVVYSYIQCPYCKAHDFDILSGRGVYIASIEFGEEA